MTKKDFIAAVVLMPEDAVIKAFDGDAMEILPVTGLLLDASRDPATIEICTDDP